MAQLVPLLCLPGVCMVDSPLAVTIQGGGIGRFTDMDGARFVAGFPEKIGGWNLANSTPLLGSPRGMKDWRDNASNVYLGIGTNLKLYYFALGTQTDITPLRPILTGTLTNPLATIEGSDVVVVTHDSHGLVTGDYVQLVTGTAFNGMQPTGVFAPITVLTSNTYSIVDATDGLATGTGGGGGGTVSYVYFRVTLSGPFTTTNNSYTVKVTHDNHGAQTGDYVEIAGASSVGGITISGEYVVGTVIDENNYDITSATKATSSTSGGGTPNFQYCITSGQASATTNYGYSTGTYSGSQGYSQTSSDGVIVPPRVWALAPYGEQLLAAPYGGTIYIWDPTVGGRAYPMYNAPTSVVWIFVTPERFVFALGINGELMEIAWPDQNSYNDWTTTPTNTANEGRTLQTGSYMVGGIPVRDGVSMVYTNKAAYVFSYSGDNFVYDDQTAGDECGLVGPLACVSVGGINFWMGTNEFWTWNGSVMPMGSDDIRDYVFKNINLTQAYKFCAGVNIAKKEIWFWYVSASGTEIDSYVIFHMDQSCWSKGSVLQRTSWVDRGLWPNPMAVDYAGNIYNQESGPDANGMALYSHVTYNPLTIGKGAANQDIFGFVNDFERISGNLSLIVLTQQYPQDSPIENGPYTIADDDSTPRIDLRLSGKMVGFDIESNVVGGDWRLGLPMVEVQQAGARR